MQSNTKQRRPHDAQFKARVLRACDEPGASVAAVAREYGLNDKLVHQWRRSRGIRALAVKAPEREACAVPQFIALPLPGATGAAPEEPPVPPATTKHIRLQMRRGAVEVDVSWPMAQAAQCAAWLREVLR